MKDQIKQTRIQLDDILQTIKQTPPNRELALCYTAIQKGFMYLGLTLGVIGEANPYPESMDKSSAVIENPTDKFTGEITADYWNDRIAAVKDLRLRLQITIGSLYGFKAEINSTILPVAEQNPVSLYKFNHPIEVVIDSLLDGKLWLGQELNNILELQNAASVKEVVVTVAGPVDEFDPYLSAAQAHYANFSSGKNMSFWNNLGDTEKAYWLNTAKRMATTPEAVTATGAA
jgi:hypothetical protein